MVLVIAIWTTEKTVLIPAVIVAGVFIGVNNTVTTQAVMTVSPVERPVASAAYGFVRFIGGGLAPFAVGKLVEAFNVHVPFYIAAAALVLGIGILATAHRILGQAEQVGLEAPAAQEPSLVAVAQSTESRRQCLWAAQSSPPSRVPRSPPCPPCCGPARHAHEYATADDITAEGDDLDSARAAVQKHLDHLAAMGVPAIGHIVLNAPDHGAAGRLVAQHANELGARAIVIGAPSHGGLPALMDTSAGHELWRNAHCDVLIINSATREENRLAPNAA